MRDDLLDLIEAAIAGAHDLDVRDRDYAKAVLAALEKEYEMKRKDASHE
jgi:hypothetical protein